MVRQTNPPSGTGGAREHERGSRVSRYGGLPDRSTLKRLLGDSARLRRPSKTSEGDLRQISERPRPV